ncbi:MAG TPA: thioesterase family protein [Stellaceae bacterium]|nr:thioesterase family protein [Stellaceae bacterium]
MGEWIETYRGIVAPWECDVTEHFTVAYYFDRLAVAAALAAKALGLVEPARGSVRLDLRFVRELRAGASFHVESAPLAIPEDGVRLAHRFVDSAKGESVTWVEQELALSALPPELRADLERRIVPWEGPPIETRPVPATRRGFFPTSRDRVRPADLDESGHLSLAGFVHRFTAGCIQGLAAIGLSAEYMHEERRGYSTFELKLAIDKAPRLGDAVLVETGILHLGNSSVRFLHAMVNPESGEEFGRLGQFGVQLDLDARRPAALPPQFRARAQALMMNGS